MIRENEPQSGGGRKGGKTVSFKNPIAPKPCTLDGEVCGIWLRKGECFNTKCKDLHPLDRKFDTPVWSKGLATKRRAGWNNTLPSQTRVSAPSLKPRKDKKKEKKSTTKPPKKESFKGSSALCVPYVSGKTRQIIG